MSSSSLMDPLVREMIEQASKMNKSTLAMVVVVTIIVIVLVGLVASEFSTNQELMRNVSEMRFLLQSGVNLK